MVNYGYDFIRIHRARALHRQLPQCGHSQIQYRQRAQWALAMLFMRAAIDEPRPMAGIQLPVFRRAMQDMQIKDIEAVYSR